MPDAQLQAALRLAIAALIGLGVGVERQWSGHATGPDARFAGMRTFLLLGLTGGAAGLLLSRGYDLSAAALLAACAALAIVAFVVAMRRPGAELDATTEAAAIVVTALGALSGIGWTVLAAGAGSVVVLALSEKARLHGTVGRIDEDELRGALRFSVLALVVLPILPQETRIGGVLIQPRTIWMIVLFFCALNYAAFVARRLVSPDRGYGVAGALGGFISSTAVTLLFSRRSRSQPGIGGPLAGGVIAACTVLAPRVLAVSAVIDPGVSLRLLPYIGPPLLVGAGLTTWAVSRRNGADAPTDDSPRGSPLRLRIAIQMALAFQVSMLAIEYARSRWALPGLYATAAVLGLTDVDALTVSMSRGTDLMSETVAARAIAAGILANTLFKATLAAALGGPGFRLRAAGGLLLMAGSAIAALWLF